MKKILSSLVMFAMVFSMVGSLPVRAGATAVDKINICHKTGDSWMFMDTPAGPSLDGHLGHGDFLYTGPEGEGSDAWCESNAPVVEGGNFSEVTLCKEDTEGNRLEGWTLKLHDNINGPAENDFEGVTGQDGCVTFDDVPYDNDDSTHEVIEVEQDGWEYVSGQVDVTIDQPEEEFIVVNRSLTPDPETATISAKKVVCDSEADLPNWGAGGHGPITSTTATDWVDQSDGNCHLADWTFEWAPSDTVNPGDNQEVGGDAWTTFTSTISIPVPSNPSYVWVREQIPSTYVPFSGATSNLDDEASKNSAEIYCNVDVLNYDNYDRVDNMQAGGTYNCVAFNAPKVQACDATDVVQTFVSDTSTTDEDGPSVALSFIHSAWDAVISGATWIWATDPVITVPNTDVTKTFTKTFTISGTPTSGILDVAADNSYTVKVNGNVVPVIFDENNFQSGTQDSYDVSAFLIGGVNTLEITVTNWGVGQSTNPTENPAGLLYKLVTHENDCLPPPPQTCNAEVNLLENGGFEAPALSNGTWDIIPDSNPLLGWLVSWVNPLSVGRLGLEIQNHVAGDPSEGDQHAELDGDHPVTISQTVDTIPGKEYSLSFKYSPRPGRDLADNSLQVKIDGSIVGADVAIDGTANGNTTWETITRNFVATGTTTKVEIYDNGTDTSYGGYVDSASVRCVGEPQEPETGHIVVNKITNVQIADHTFNFTTTGAGYNSFFLASGGSNDQELASGNTYSVSENPTSGWNSDGGVCVTNQDYNQTPGEINLHAGETVTCTFTNTFIQVDPNPACSDDADNDEDGLTDAQDPGCHSDGNVNNPESYVPSDNDESNTSAQCGDGKDNDEDNKIDSQDPGCMSGEGGLWNPSDNDETDPVVPVDVCPNIPGVQTTVPHGKHINNSGNCVNNGGASGGVGGGSAPTGKVLGAETSCGIYLDKYLKQGRKNDPEAVKKVQKFLNDFLQAGLKEDGVFGPNTDKHVKKFQQDHKDKILDPWKLKAPTGIVYLTTQTEINNIMCPTLGLPVPTNLIPFETNPAFPKS